mgnify:CR=1 FL=1
MDYKEIADQIIIAIGGQDNVKYVTLCYKITICIKK